MVPSGYFEGERYGWDRPQRLFCLGKLLQERGSKTTSAIVRQNEQFINGADFPSKLVGPERNQESITDWMTCDFTHQGPSASGVRSQL